MHLLLSPLRMVLEAAGSHFFFLLRWDCVFLWLLVCSSQSESLLNLWRGPLEQFPRMNSVVVNLTGPFGAVAERVDTGGLQRGKFHYQHGYIANRRSLQRQMSPASHERTVIQMLLTPATKPLTTAYCWQPAYRGSCSVQHCPRPGRLSSIYFHRYRQ